MNPDSLPSFDEWLKEAMRLADDHALWYSQTRDEPHAGRRATLLAHLAAHPSAAPQGAQPGAPEGYALVPCIGTVVKAKHPITCLNPTEFFEVTQVRAESDGKFAVRGEQTCWFGLNYLVSAASPADVAPVPQALAGPLEQPLEPTSDQANLAQASGGDDLQTALPELRRAVRTAWLAGTDNFRHQYDEALFAALGITHFQDLYTNEETHVTPRQ